MESSVKTVSNTRNWKLLLALGFLLLCPSLCMFWYWQRVVQPPRLTSLHGQEFSPVIADFAIMEGSLDVQLHPEKILAVASGEYLSVFERINSALHCPRCDQFWVTTAAQATEICVLEYSSSRSKVRVTITEEGYMADAVSYHPLKAGLSQQDRSTYHLVKEDGVWKVARITDYTLPTKGTADLLELFDEYRAELGCPPSSYSGK